MSSQDTTDNFWQVWNNFVWPQPPAIFYRCYYLEDGTVDFYTMEDLPGNYIEVEQTVYVLAPKPARVINGKLEITKPTITVQKLAPSFNQGTLCHPQDVSVIVDKNGAHWELKTYEKN